MGRMYIERVLSQSVEKFVLFSNILEYVMGGTYKMRGHDNKRSSPNVLSITESRRVRWDGLVAYVENMKGRVRLEDTRVFRRIVLKPVPLKKSVLGCGPD